MVKGSFVKIMDQNGSTFDSKIYIEEVIPYEMLKKEPDNEHIKDRVVSCRMKMTTYDTEGKHFNHRHHAVLAEGQIKYYNTSYFTLMPAEES